MWYCICYGLIWVNFGEIEQAIRYISIWLFLGCWVQFDDCNFYRNFSRFLFRLLILGFAQLCVIFSYMLYLWCLFFLMKKLSEKHFVLNLGTVMETRFGNLKGLVLMGLLERKCFWFVKGCVWVIDIGWHGHLCLVVWRWYMMSNIQVC
jgi:hypothetical protein